MCILLLGVVYVAKAEQTYRLEIGYVQPYQASTEYRSVYFHGGKIGGTVDFHLPYNMTIQTGLMYTFSYGDTQQHWSTNSTAGTEYVDNKLYSHALNIPIHYTYTQKIWSKLAVFFYGGPNLQIGLAQTQDAVSYLSDEKLEWLQNTCGLTSVVGQSDLYQDGTLRRFNFQLGVGGGFQWDKFRIQSGYDFGMFSISKQYNAHQRGWYASFSYAF